MGTAASLTNGAQPSVFYVVEAAEGTPKPTVSRFCEVVAPPSVSEIDKKRKKTQVDSPAQVSMSEVVVDTQNKLLG